MPIFQYHLPGISQPISTTCRAWHTPLPVDRHLTETLSSAKDDTGPTRGDYFTAGQHFLETNGFAMLLGAIASRLGRPVLCKELREIHLTLIKHGAFYHPALISVHGFGAPLKFVLNAAASTLGRQTIQSEYAALEQLNRTSCNAYVPSVHGQGTVQTRAGRSLDMFLGDWFDGFHEFHLSQGAANTPPQLRVWDDDRGVFFLNVNQGRALYRQAAFILTVYYNPRTFEQIFPWHHAAGDFVVRTGPSGLEVRLITVRRYAPLFQDIEMPADEPAQRQQTMMGLLFFLLNLSIRMRIDRLDGTGELVWGGAEAVTSVWEGFLSGLQHSCFPWSFPEDMASAFKTFLVDIPVSEMFDLAQAAAGGFHPHAAERALIAPHLVDHIATLRTSIEQKGFA
jgi:hypothetical protein